MAFENKWNQTKKQNDTVEKKENSAYIDKETRALSESDPVLAKLAENMLEKATILMDAAHESGLDIERTTRDKNTTYSAKGVVHVEYANITKPNGEPIYQITTEIKNDKGHSLILWGAGRDGGVEITALSASKWIRNEYNSPELKIYRQEEIAKAPIAPDIKNLAAFVADSGMVVPKQQFNNKSSMLFEFSKYANEQFSALNGKTTINNQGKEVNNVYARYSKENGKEFVLMAAHILPNGEESKTQVKLFEGKDGKPSAQLLNWSLTDKTLDDGSTVVVQRKDGEPPHKEFINTPKDLLNAIEKQGLHDAIADGVAAFKGFGQDKEQTKTKPMERG